MRVTIRIACSMSYRRLGSAYAGVEGVSRAEALGKVTL
jgi:hypothetical protein